MRSVCKICSETALVAAVMAMIGCSSLVSDARADDACKKLYATSYVKKDGHKAFATTGGRSINSKLDTACGEGHGYRTRKKAETRAIAECKIDSANTGIAGNCTIIYAE